MNRESKSDVEQEAVADEAPTPLQEVCFCKLEKKTRHMEEFRMAYIYIYIVIECIDGLSLISSFLLSSPFFFLFISLLRLLCVLLSLVPLISCKSVGILCGGD